MLLWIRSVAAVPPWPTCNVNDFGYSYLFLLLFVEAALVAAIGLCAASLWI